MPLFVSAAAVCAIPVPLHASRRRHRGFNQAADLARHVGVPAVAALRRVRPTPTQTGLPAAQRHRAQHPAGPRALERQLLRLPEHRGEERRVAEDGPVVVAEHVAASEVAAEVAALRRRLSTSSRVRTTRFRAT